MDLREFLAPGSIDQIVYVILLWAMSIVVVTQYYNTPLVRLEIVIGTGLILLWTVWGIYERLDTLRRERHESSR